MRSKNQDEKKKLSISSFYEYVFEDKAKSEIVIHESSKKEKKVATLVQCGLLLQANSPIGSVITDAIKPIYILAPEGLYYVADPVKPVSNDDLIPESKNKIAQLWKSLGNKNNATPYDAKLMDINPKQQRIISMLTTHRPREKTEEEFVLSTKKSNKITTEEEAKQKILNSKALHQRKKIDEFTDLLNDQELSLSFRQMLRKIGSSSLEILLFENVTDPLPEVHASKYALPAEDEIKIKFDDLDAYYHFFSGDDNEEIKNAFVIFFKGCKLMADYIEKNNDADDTVAASHAYKMLVLFGFNKSKKEMEKSNPFQYVEEYFAQHVGKESSHPIHDTLINDIPINQPELEEEIEEIKEWRKLIQKYGKQAIDYFQQAPAIEHILKHAPIDLDEAKNAAAKIGYACYQEYPELAKLCLQYHVSEENFDKCLRIEKIRKSDDLLPNVSINGNDVGHPDYYLVKLPIDDPRAYILGHITNCCQSIGGHSEKCVIDGVTRKNNGFYVLLKRNKPGNTINQPVQNNKINYQAFSIVGQGYAWLSKGGNFVFDSWENLRPENDDAVIIPMLQEFAKKVIENSPEMLRANIGTGGKTPKGFSINIPYKEIEEIAEGHQYSDSKSQSLLSFNHKLLNKLTNQLVEQENFDWDIEALSQVLQIDRIYSIDQIKRIENLFLKENCHLIWDELAGNDKNLTKSERKKIMTRFLDDNRKSFAVQGLEEIYSEANTKLLTIDGLEKMYADHQKKLEFIDSIYQQKTLNPDYLQKLRLAITKYSYANFVDLTKNLQLFEKVNMLNSENYNLITNEAEYVNKYSKWFDLMVNNNLLTDDILKAAIKYKAIPLANRAMGVLHKEGILTKHTVKIIFDVLTKSIEDPMQTDPNGYKAADKISIIADNLVGFYMLNIPLTEEILLNACISTPDSIMFIMRGFVKVMQHYHSSTENAGKFIEGPLLISIFKKLLTETFGDEWKDIDEPLLLLSKICIFLCKVGILTNSNYDDIIAIINNPSTLRGFDLLKGILTGDNFDNILNLTKNPSVREGLETLVKRGLLVKSNINILINNPNDAVVIADGIAKLQNSLMQFIDEANPQKQSLQKQSYSLFSSFDIRNYNKLYPNWKNDLKIANKILQILKGEQQAVAFDDSDRKGLKENAILQLIIKESGIVSELLMLADNNEDKSKLVDENEDKNKLVDKSEQLYFLIYKESVLFNKNYTLTVSHPDNKEKIASSSRAQELMGSTEIEVIPLNMPKLEFFKIMNEISPDKSLNNISFFINEDGKKLLKSANAEQHHKSIESEIITQSKKI